MSPFGVNLCWRHFFLNKSGQAVTITGGHYSDMITQFCPPKYDHIDVANMRFQQDSATCHTPRETIQL